MREFLEVIESNESCLFVVIIGGVEIIMTTDELMEIMNDVEVDSVDLIKGRIVGKMFGENVEVEVV